MKKQTAHIIGICALALALCLGGSPTFSAQSDALDVAADARSSIASAPLLAPPTLLTPPAQAPEAGAPAMSASEWEAHKQAINRDFKGLWVATVVNLDYPYTPTQDPARLKRDADRILDDAQTMGMNAIVFQVRPTGDALYPNAFFPWSEYLTGKRGLAPTGDFDPLAYWIEGAHKRGMVLHAWINPYRLTKKSGSDSKQELKDLADGHPGKLHPSWVVAHKDGNLYFDPGNPEVRAYLVDSIEDIVKRYDVDGIHFDDYFYPGSDFDDAASFKAYGRGFSELSEWRRYNVDQLVSEVYKTIKATDPSVQFGISPFGIWANESAVPGGSKTKGYQSYVNQYADTRKWVQSGMLDYIAPQLYWHIGYSIADYKVLLDWWTDVAKESAVNLYIGQASYRTGNRDPESPWHGIAELIRQMALNTSNSTVRGHIFFRAGSFDDNYVLRDYMRRRAGTGVYAQGAENAELYFPLTIGRPLNDRSTTAASYYLGGASDSRYPLYLNGQEVTDRTPMGFFGKFVSLKMGTNTFVVEQNGQRVKRVITRKKPAVAGPMSRVEIPRDSVWPQSVRGIENGGKAYFSCKAPIGAEVSVTLSGKTYALEAAQKRAQSGAVYATTYSLTQALPYQYGTPRVVSFGNPVYRMTYKGKTYTQTAPGRLSVIMEGAPYAATVVPAYADTYENPYSGDGRHFILNGGMQGYVRAEKGEYVCLGPNLWIKRDDITFTSGSIEKSTVGKVSVETQKRETALYFPTTGHPIVTADLKDGGIRVAVMGASSAHGTDHLYSADVSGVSVQDVPGSLSYTVALKAPDTLLGYYVQSVPDGFRLVLRKKCVPEGDRPLSGTVVMLDPGHGGKDSGGIGLMGGVRAEKHVVLEEAFRVKDKLETLGAQVVMTRTEDVYVSLEDRLNHSRQVMPDLFVSIHADSLGDASNLTRVSGSSVFYKEDIAKAFSDDVSRRIVSQHGRVNRGSKHMNFYVVRGTWTPSILIEMGFLPHPMEYQALVDPVEQERFADTLVDAILAYFR